MRTKNILVTGGSGFIGGYVVDELLGRGYDVTVFDHSLHKSSASDPDIDYYVGDIRDAEAVTEAMSHADGFIHLAGVLGTQETIQNPKPAILTNITGGLNVLEAAAQYQVPGVNIAVGNHWEQNPYSISKSTVERLAKMYALYRDTKVSTVRALNAYGPGQSVAAPYGTSKVRKIVPSFVMRALHSQPIEIYGDGSQVMDMIYVGDVAMILADALEWTSEHGPLPHVVEAGTGRLTTVLDVARVVAGLVPGTEFRFLPMRPGETVGRPVLADRSTQEILYGTQPNDEPWELLSLEQVMPATVAYYKSRG